MTLHGIDIGRDQAGINIAATPADFIIIGASDGGAVNPFFHQQYAATKAAGKRRGAYHFFRGNPDAEARFFVANAAEVPGDGHVWCDAETAAPNLPALVLQWLETVRSLTGVKPAGAYTPADFIFNHGYDWSPVINAGYALWEAAYVLGYQPVAAYNVPTGRRPVPGWEPCTWQYTSSGQVPGWGAAVDLNIFYGDTAAWDALVGGITTQSSTITPITEGTFMALSDADQTELLLNVRKLAASLVPGNGTHADLSEVTLNMRKAVNNTANLPAALLSIAQGIGGIKTAPASPAPVIDVKALAVELAPLLTTTQAHDFLVAFHNALPGA